MADFKDRLREIRMERGLTQQELGDKIGLHGMSISGYERGVKHPSFEALDNMADALDVSLDYLLGRSDVNTGYPRHYNLQEITLAADGRVLYDARDSDNDLDRRVSAYAKAIHKKLARAYDEASPDTQAAVRAILHVKEDPDGDR